LAAVLSEDTSQTRQTSLATAISVLEEALARLAPDRFPYLVASTELTLGMLWRERQGRNAADAIEQAIAYYEMALRIFTRKRHPFDWAAAHMDLGNAYATRLYGSKEENIERAILNLRRALFVYTHADYPADWASLQHNIGSAYTDRLRGKRALNVDAAIACYQDALTVRTEENAPEAWAETQLNLGTAYCIRVEGERVANLLEARACFERALRHFRRDSAPERWAAIMHDLGVVVAELAAPGAEARDSDRDARDFAPYFRRAQEVYTAEAFPADYRGSSLMLAEAYAELGEWERAHGAYGAALDGEASLLALADSAFAVDAIVRDGRDGAFRDAFALAKLGRYGEAALTAERGRARGLATALRIDAGDPSLITDDALRATYVESRDRWRAAIAEAHSHSDRLAGSRQVQAARAAFDAAVEAIRAARAPAAFLRDDLTPETLFGSSRLGGTSDAPSASQRHTIVYLIATPWGGVALAAFPVREQRPLRTPQKRAQVIGATYYAALDLPALTERAAGAALTSDQMGAGARLTGGLAYAQEGAAFKMLLDDWPGMAQSQEVDRLERAWLTSEPDDAEHIADELARVRLTGSLRSSLEQLQQTEATERSGPHRPAGSTEEQRAPLLVALLAALRASMVAALANTPYNAYTEDEWALMENVMTYRLLRSELDRCRPLFARAAMRPLYDWLTSLDVDSLTLIPCGFLAAFPLLSCPVGASDAPISALLPSSVTPSARALVLASEERRATEPQRSGVYALGDPNPSTDPLWWGRAEAAAVATLAGAVGRAAVGQDATKEWALAALRSGQVLSASCHGETRREYLRSYLTLADGATLTLADAFDLRVTDARGLRLLILSACQTALTDLRGARDEARSLAAGWLQAGVRAVIATLWPVDDRAAYLLMARFAEIWFPSMATLPPAQALAQAQDWLRTRSEADLRSWRWYDPSAVLESLLGHTSVNVEARPSGDVEGGVENEGAPSNMSDTRRARRVDSHRVLIMRGRGAYVDDEPSDALFAPTRAHEDVSAPDVSPASAALPATRRPYAHPYYWAAFQLFGW
jgi:CHAT domain-containing protein/tetratricopeptide (TPR) repeat protein